MQGQGETPLPGGADSPNLALAFQQLGDGKHLTREKGLRMLASLIKEGGLLGSRRGTQVIAVAWRTTSRCTWAFCIVPLGGCTGKAGDEVVLPGVFDLLAGESWEKRLGGLMAAKVSVVDVRGCPSNPRALLNASER